MILHPLFTPFLLLIYVNEIACITNILNIFDIPLDILQIMLSFMEWWFACRHFFHNVIFIFHSLEVVGATLLQISIEIYNYTLHNVFFRGNVKRVILLTSSLYDIPFLELYLIMTHPQSVVLKFLGMSIVWFSIYGVQQNSITWMFNMSRQQYTFTVL